MRMARAIHADEQLCKHCFACQCPDHFIRNCPPNKKCQEAPKTEGASQKQVSPSSSQSKGATLFTCSATTATNTPTGSGKVKGPQPVPCLNPDPFKHTVGPKNFIDRELTTCLLDNGAQLNFVAPAYAIKWGLNVMSLDRLAKEAGGNLPPI